MDLYVYSGYGPYLIIQACGSDQAAGIVRDLMVEAGLPSEDIDAAEESLKPLELPHGAGIAVEWWG